MQTPFEIAIPFFIVAIVVIVLMAIAIVADVKERKRIRKNKYQEPKRPGIHNQKN